MGVVGASGRRLCAPWRALPFFVVGAVVAGGERCAELSAEAVGDDDWVELNDAAVRLAACSRNADARRLLRRATALAPLDPTVAQNAFWLHSVDDDSIVRESEPLTVDLAERAMTACKARALAAAFEDDAALVSRVHQDGAVGSLRVKLSHRAEVAVNLKDGSKASVAVVALPEEWSSRTTLFATEEPRWNRQRAPRSVMDLELGRLLCDSPGMNTTTTRKLGAADFAVDVVKKWITGYLHAPHLADPSRGVDSDLLYTQRPNMWDVGYVNIGSSALDWDSRRSEVVSSAHVGSLNLLAAAVADVLERRVPGDVAECGVFRGGTLALAAVALDTSGTVADGRFTWAFDTFEGVPRGDMAADAATEDWPGGAYAAPLEEVESNFRRLGVIGRLRTVQAAFADVPPDAPFLPASLAVLRVDADTFHGTYDALTLLYDRVAVGGLVIVDDFHLQGARRALRAFRAERRITAPLLPAPLDYVLSCPLTPDRQSWLALDLLFSPDPPRLKRHLVQLPQNVYFRKEEERE